jgi:hypothetical protein
MFTVETTKSDPSKIAELREQKENFYCGFGFPEISGQM